MKYKCCKFYSSRVTGSGGVKDIMGKILMFKTNKGLLCVATNVLPCLKVNRVTQMKKTKVELNDLPNIMHGNYKIAP